MNAKHTATPWRMDCAYIDVYGNASIYGPNRNHVAQVWGGSKPSTEVVRANAEMIVRAVNAHDELVAALRRSTDLLAEVLRTIADNDTADEIGECTYQANVALSKAEEA